MTLTALGSSPSSASTSWNLARELEVDEHVGVD